MMAPNARQLCIVLLPAIAILLILHLSFFADDTVSSLSSTSSADSAVDMSFHDLKVSLSTTKSKLSPSEPLSLHLTVENTAPSPLTVLVWNTPLDPSAGALGLFALTAAGTGEVVRPDSVKISRKLPPNVDDDFVEIPPAAWGGKIERDVTIPAPMLKMLEGKKGTFKVSGQGKWTAVWKAKKKGVERQALEEMRGQLEAEWKTDEVDVDVDFT